MQLVEVNMPHHLAWFPLEMIEKIKDRRIRENLRRKWVKASQMLENYGEEHPPVIVVNAWRNSKGCVPRALYRENLKGRQRHGC